MTQLINRNITVGERRTSIRLDAEMWSALEEMCHRDGVTLAALVTSLTGAAEYGDRTALLRAAIVRYYRAAATEAGHKAAGHGSLDALVRELAA
jgi:predicted DNA-binding ribbon-helix-helix protein